MRTRNSPEKYPFNDWSGPLEGLEQFELEVWDKAQKKFGVDQDGECPLDIEFIDRTKFAPMHYKAVPYNHQAKTEEERGDIYILLSMNLATALREMDLFMAMKQDFRIRKK